jgi:seryl-tRNA synthetase
MWGTPRDEVGLPNHVDLVGMLDIVDLEKGQEVAGSRGYYLKGAVRSQLFTGVSRCGFATDSAPRSYGGCRACC